MLCRFWRNKVHEIVQVQKQYMLEFIQNQEIERLRAKAIRQDLKNKKDGVGKVAQKASIVDPMKGITTKSSLSSIFKAKKEAKMIESKSKESIKYEPIDDSAPTHPKVVSSKDNMTAQKNTKVNKAKTKPRPKQESTMTNEHKNLLQNDSEIDRITNKVIATGTESLSPEELKLYNQLSNIKLPTSKSKPSQNPKKKKAKNVTQS